VLVCVALLGIFAGSLMPAATVPSSAASATPTPYSSQRTAAGYTFNLNVTPDRFGNNTFTVTVKDSGGQPLTGATVIITLTSTDMDMGVEKPQLQPVAGKPGVYSAQNTITMAGNWQVVLDVTPAGAQSPIETTFRFAASY
jgi:nitrogen fixation protein FixH